MPLSTSILFPSPVAAEPIAPSLPSVIHSRDVVFAPTSVPTGLVARTVHWRGMYMGNVVLCQDQWYIAHSPQGHTDIMSAVNVLVENFYTLCSKYPQCACTDFCKDGDL